jgi:hypothetical protein
MSTNEYDDYFSDPTGELPPAMVKALGDPFPTR